MCLRLSLFHENNTQSTYMSLSFILMRGEFDAILKWPFEYKISFCLYDQSGAKRHICHTINPQTQSNNFQRPRSEMSAADTIPKFCALEVIKDNYNTYVRDDSMFIKVIVHFSEIPDDVLTYAFNLDPGLPSEQRFEKIQAEF